MTTDISCAQCGQEFSVPSWEARRGRTYCSRTCGNREKAIALADAAIALAPKNICAACGCEFSLAGRPRANPNKYCSNACRYRHKRGPNGAAAGPRPEMRGDRNPNWQGGAPESRRETYRQDGRVKVWRGIVYARDGYSCQRCGSTTRRLAAHHIAPWKSAPELRFEPGNGIALCQPCHIWVHSPNNVDGHFLAPANVHS